MSRPRILGILGLCSKATTTIASMPGFINRCTSMPEQSRALACPERGVTPGIRPHARCHIGEASDRTFPESRPTIWTAPLGLRIAILSKINATSYDTRLYVMRVARLTHAAREARARGRRRHAQHAGACRPLCFMVMVTTRWRWWPRLRPSLSRRFNEGAIG